MIPVSSSTLDTNSEIKTISIDGNWQKQLANAFKTPKDLLKHLNLSEESLPYKLGDAASFRTKVTQHFANLMRTSDPFDPLLLQVLPLEQESDEVEGYVENPLQEDQFSSLPGLIHKYKNRVLIIAHQACAVHCRYCFRRHFPYSEARLSDLAIDDICQYIGQHPDINEVILSGGDPLSLSDAALISLLNRFDQIDQISTIRIHSRTPVVLPERITEQLLTKFAEISCNIVMVLHINHPREISETLKEKLKLLTEINVTLLNQTVLLRNINDDATTLISLSNALFRAGILPYYLHLLDPVQGAHHFEVEQQAAQELWLQMQSNLSGYLLPKLVRETPNELSKTWKNPIA